MRLRLILKHFLTIFDKSKINKLLVPKKLFLLLLATALFFSMVPFRQVHAVIEGEILQASELSNQRFEYKVFGNRLGITAVDTTNSEVKRAWKANDAGQGYGTYQIEMTGVKSDGSAGESTEGDFSATGVGYVLLEPRNANNIKAYWIGNGSPAPGTEISVGKANVAKDFLGNQGDGGADADNDDPDPSADPTADNPTPQEELAAQQIPAVKALFLREPDGLRFCSVATFGGPVADAISANALSMIVASYIVAGGYNDDSGKVLRYEGNGETTQLSIGAGKGRPLFECLSTAYGNELSDILGLDPFEAVNTPDPAEEAEGEPCYDGGKTLFGVPTNPLKWLVCGVSQLIGEGLDRLNEGIANLLDFNPTSANSGELKAVWGRILQLSNFLFVIAFLVMIISTALDLGVFSSYTVKKLLPRIIIAALLANLSWGITATLTDITNVIGGAAQAVILSPLNLGNGEPVFDTSTAEAFGYAVSAGDGAGLMQGAVVAGLGALIYFSLASAGAILLPIIATAFIAALIAFGALLLRRIIIVLLIIFAPLAFALWALPNGEKMFQRWWKLFIQMLMMYPMMMALFASGIFLSRLIAGSGSSASGLGIMGAATAFMALILPYLLIPTLFKLAGGVLGNITGMLNDRGKGLIDRSRKWRDEGSQYGRRKQQKAALKNYRGHEKLLESMDKKTLAGSEWLQRRRRAQGLGRNWAQGKHAAQTQNMFLAKAKAAASKERFDSANYLLQANGAGGIDYRNPDGSKKMFQMRDKNGNVVGMRSKDDALRDAIAYGHQIWDLDGAQGAEMLSDGSVDARRAAAQYATGQGLAPVIKGVQDINSTNPDRRGAAMSASILSEAMNTNVGSMMQKMPSYFKGRSLAFEGMTAQSLQGYHEYEVPKIFDYYKEQVGASATGTAEEQANARESAELTMASLGQSIVETIRDPGKYSRSPKALREIRRQYNDLVDRSGGTLPAGVTAEMDQAIRRININNGSIDPPPPETP